MTIKITTKCLAVKLSFDNLRVLCNFAFLFRKNFIGDKNFLGL